MLTTLFPSLHPASSSILALVRSKAAFDGAGQCAHNQGVAGRSKARETWMASRVPMPAARGSPAGPNQ